MYHQMPLRAACLAYPSTLNMAAVSSFWKPLIFYQTTRRHILEDISFRLKNYLGMYRRCDRQRTHVGPSEVQPIGVLVCVNGTGVLEPWWWMWSKDALIFWSAHRVYHPSGLVLWRYDICYRDVDIC
jgi:hypothetical protein